jgi:hypothetical protein
MEAGVVAQGLRLPAVQVRTLGPAPVVSQEGAELKEPTDADCRIAGAFGGPNNLAAQAP